MCSDYEYFAFYCKLFCACFVKLSVLNIGRIYISAGNMELQYNSLKRFTSNLVTICLNTDSIIVLKNDEGIR